MLIALDDQIACVRREIAMRHRVYPGQVQRGLITQAWADYQVAAMQAVLATLTQLQETAADGAQLPLVPKEGPC